MQVGLAESTAKLKVLEEYEVSSETSQVDIRKTPPDAMSAYMEKMDKLQKRPLKMLERFNPSTPGVSEDQITQLEEAVFVSTSSQSNNLILR